MQRFVQTVEWSIGWVPGFAGNVALGYLLSEQTLVHPNPLPKRSSFD